MLQEALLTYFLCHLSEMVIFQTISNAWHLGFVELSFPQPYCPTSGRVAQGSTSHQIAGVLEADLKGVQSPGPLL